MVRYEVFNGERSEKPGKNNDSASVTSGTESCFGALLSHPMVTSLDATRRSCALRVLPAGESVLSKELADIKTLGDLGGFSRSD